MISADREGIYADSMWSTADRVTSYADREVIFLDRIMQFPTGIKNSPLCRKEECLMIIQLHVLSSGKGQHLWDSLIVMGK